MVMRKVAMVAALEREVKPLIRTWRRTDREYQGCHFRFFENDSTVLVCGGIGEQPARRATEAVIALFSPEVIYSVGFAGALNATLKMGDILLPRQVIDARDGSRVDTGEGQGALVSFPSIADPRQKSELARAYSAQAVDMEAAAVARGAQARGLRFAAVQLCAVRGRASLDVEACGGTGAKQCARLECPLPPAGNSRARSQRPGDGEQR